MATKAKNQEKEIDVIDVKYEGKNIIELIRLLIRYDIPVLMLGKSSIGKSYTMISIAKEWKLPNQILYVGSEKSEHIEGLPKLTGLQKGDVTLEYLQPYWFPDEQTISKMVTNGRNLFEDFKNYYIGDFNYTFDVLNNILNLFGLEQYEASKTSKIIELKDENVRVGEEPIIYSKPFKVEREIVEKGAEGYHRDDLRDICVYLCTLLGYGNFWLILDEIDKVADEDVDKFAPLLHIVRERWLKKWKLQPINEGKGVTVTKMVKGSNYIEIKKMIDNSIDSNPPRPLLDTRIIAIANKTKNIEDALFRRFLQVVVEELLLLRPIAPEDDKIRECIEKKLGDEEMSKDLKKGLDPKRIGDVNLQWSLNFFNKILNNVDIEGNFVRKNYLEIMADNKVDAEKEPAEWAKMKNELGKLTMLYKIIDDNFDGAALKSNLFDCLSSQIEVKYYAGDNPINLARAHIQEMLDDAFDIYEQRDSIIEKLDELYPTENKLDRIDNWTEMCLAYLTATMFEKGKFFQTELGKILIPSIQKFIYEKLTKDTALGIDTVKGQLEKVSRFWEKIVTGENAIPLNKIKVKPEEVQKALYGATIDELKKLKDSEKVKLSENTIFGAGKYIKSESDTTLAYKKSLSYSLIMKQVEDLLVVLQIYTKTYPKKGGGVFQIINQLIESKEYPSIIKYAKDNHLARIKQYIASLKASKKQGAEEIANEMSKLIS